MEEMLFSIKNKGASKGHLVFVVPDRMTVNIEKKIFETLEIESTCDIEVLTLSRLFARLNRGQSILSKSASCMIIEKILREEKENFKCFTKNFDSDLAEVIFGTISQFKSCKVNFDEVEVKNGNKLLEDKLFDIALVYRKYAEFLRKKGLFDALDKLNFLSEAVKSSQFVKNSAFYFCGFDGLTLQGFDIVRNVSRVAREFNFALTHAESAANAHIYNDDFSTKILNILKDRKPQFFRREKSLGCKKDFLCDNLFCFMPQTKKVKNSEVELFEATDFREEVLCCAATIKKMMVKEGKKFDDFFVAIPNFSQKKMIVEQVFSQFDFNFYLDTQEEFSTSVVFRFLMSAADMFRENYSIKSVLTFLKNPLLNLAQNELDDFEDYALKFDLKNFYDLKSISFSAGEFYENFFKVRSFLFDKTLTVSEKLTSANTFGEHLLAFKELVENCYIEKRLEEICREFSFKNNLLQLKIFEQYYSALESVFDEIENVLDAEKCDFKTFQATLQSGLAAVKISTTPLSIDSIVVGDCSSSFFENRKVLFVLSASEENFPKTLADNGLISDKDIAMLSERYKLEPSIFELNKKEQFKAFELLLKPSEKLHLSYNFLEGERSKLLSDISKMFLVEKEGKFAPLEFQRFEELGFEIRNCVENVARNNLTKKIREMCDGVENDDKVISILYASLLDKLPKNFLENFQFENKLSLQENIFFKKNTTSVSQVESFMTCPFSHFASRGLELASKDEGQLKSNFIGLILHEVARDVLLEIDLPQNDEKVVEKTIKVFEKVVAKEDYISLVKSDSNRTLLKNLKNEAVKFLLAINFQSRHSAFKTKFVEKRFDDRGELKSLKIPLADKVLSLVGQVDRIDQAEDYFRVVDYKTGDVKTSLRELFFGKKIQLETYLMAVEKSLKLKIAGGYYLPVKGGFGGEEASLQKKYQLKGNTLDSFKVACLSDDRLGEEDVFDSDIVEIKFRKKGKEKTQSAFSKVVSEKDFYTFGNYALKLIEQACRDIEKLNITPSPLDISGKDACKMCPYYALCRFDTAFGNVTRKVNVKVSKEDFDRENLSNIVKEEQD